MQKQCNNSQYHTLCQSTDTSGRRRPFPLPIPFPGGEKTPPFNPGPGSRFFFDWLRKAMEDARNRGEETPPYNPRDQRFIEWLRKQMEKADQERRPVPLPEMEEESPPYNPRDPRFIEWLRRQMEKAEQERPVPLPGPGELPPSAPWMDDLIEMDMRAQKYTIDAVSALETKLQEVLEDTLEKYDSKMIDFITEYVRNEINVAIDENTRQMAALIGQQQAFTVDEVRKIDIALRKYVDDAMGGVETYTNVYDNRLNDHRKNLMTESTKVRMMWTWVIAMVIIMFIAMSMMRK